MGIIVILLMTRKTLSRYRMCLKFMEMPNTWDVIILTVDCMDKYYWWIIRLLKVWHCLNVKNAMRFVDLMCYCLMRVMMRSFIDRRKLCRDCLKIKKRILKSWNIWNKVIMKVMYCLLLALNCPLDWLIGLLESLIREINL